jgi:hypothetical protein
MDDATFLKGGRGHASEEEKSLLEKKESSPEEAKKRLDDMKLISQRIEEVFISLKVLNLKYIGCNHIFALRVLVLVTFPVLVCYCDLLGR